MSVSLTTRVIRVMDELSAETYYLLNLKATLVGLGLDGKVAPTFLSDLERLVEAAKENRKGMPDAK